MDGRLIDLNGRQAVSDYGDITAEYTALVETAGVLDCSYRSRLCVLGVDRAKFLNGQVTNNVTGLRTGDGCYAAIVSARGKLESDVHIYILENEILLEFEAGYAKGVQKRLEKFIIAEDAQIVDVAEACGLWSVQGPKSAEVLNKFPAPEKPHSVAKYEDATLGEIYVTNRARTGTAGYDLFVPVAAMAAAAEQLSSAANKIGGRLCGWQALETARIEAGLPRFGMDMDETNLAPEALDTNAISYSKGCYIGQEVIARIRTYGQVARALRGLRLPDNLPALPRRGDKLLLDGKDAGYITSAVASPRFKASLALGIVRREANQIGTELMLQTGSHTVPVRIVELPFRF